jgi:hypothetical protein
LNSEMSWPEALVKPFDSALSGAAAAPRICTAFEVGDTVEVSTAAGTA